MSQYVVKREADRKVLTEPMSREDAHMELCKLGETETGWLYVWPADETPDRDVAPMNTLKWETEGDTTYARSGNHDFLVTEDQSSGKWFVEMAMPDTDGGHTVIPMVTGCYDRAEAIQVAESLADTSVHWPTLWALFQHITREESSQAAMSTLDDPANIDHPMLTAVLTEWHLS